MCPPCTALLVKDDNGGEPRQTQLDEDQERAPLSDAVFVASRHFTELLNCGMLTKTSVRFLPQRREGNLLRVERSMCN
ncbi:hypothetical protein GWK47_006218 [Chionoecetes opilio]|uniref:Uncharacterized protein n=1 Tax=Chionoecetes opilio TaxID=41210 RepID=A0A8J5CWQ5_CHIOP|nr:hypothetical protein GWK47_006218 [Chionoecetes opilio]